VGYSHLTGETDRMCLWLARATSDPPKTGAARL